MGFHEYTLTIISLFISLWSFSFRILLNTWQWGVFAFPFLILTATFDASLHTLIRKAPGRGRQDHWKLKQFYRELCIVINIFNVVNSTTLLILKFIVIALITIGCVAFVLKEATSVSIAILGLCFTLLFGLLLLFKEVATPFESAEEMRQQIQNGVTRRSLWKLVGRSIRPCRINAGRQYYIDKGIPFQILDAVTKNTIHIVLPFA